MPTRRRFLAASALTTAGLAGCTDAPDVGTDDDDPGQAGGTPSPDRGTVRIGSETEAETEPPTATGTDAPPTDGERTANGTATNGTRTGGSSRA